MGPVHPPDVYQGFTDVIAAIVLLIEFGMLRQALIRDQIRLYAVQSALIALLAVVIGVERNLPDLFVLAGLTVALKVVAIPVAMRLLLGRSGGADVPGVAGSHTLSLATTVLVAIVLAAFGFFAFDALHIHSSVTPVVALTISGAMVLIGFFLMIVRRDVASQAIGFYSLDNAIALASYVVAAGLPLLLEVVFLFDLLVAVVVFAMLMRALHTRGRSLSTVDLTRLRG